jgi:hypothetical protein
MTESPTFTQPIPPPLRQCGRCRLFFPTSGDLHHAELREWWACGECAALITPSRHRSSADDHARLADDRE